MQLRSALIRGFLSLVKSPPVVTPRMPRNQYDSFTKHGTGAVNDGLDIQVRIKQAVMADYDPVYGQDDHGNPRVVWNKSPSAFKGGDRQRNETSSCKREERSLGPPTRYDPVLAVIYTSTTYREDAPSLRWVLALRRS